MYKGECSTVAGIILIIAISFIVSIFWLQTGETVEFIVDSKERIAEDGDGKYLIFTENEVFENTDSILKGKFNSSDLYNQLKEQNEYSCQVFGWRVPFLSMYRNIIECKEKGE